MSPEKRLKRINELQRTYFIVGAKTGEMYETQANNIKTAVAIHRRKLKKLGYDTAWNKLTKRHELVSLEG